MTAQIGKKRRGEWNKSTQWQPLHMIGNEIPNLALERFRISVFLNGCETIPFYMNILMHTFPSLLRRFAPPTASPSSVS